MYAQGLSLDLDSVPALISKLKVALTEHLPCFPGSELNIIQLWQLFGPVWPKNQSRIVLPQVKLINTDIFGIQQLFLQFCHEAMMLV